MPIVLRQEAEGHSGYWIVTPRAIETAEKSTAFLKGKKENNDYQRGYTTSSRNNLTGFHEAF